MRVLHVGECAFVAENLVKGLNEEGVEAEHLNKPWSLPQCKEYDVVHVHYPHHFWKLFVEKRTKYEKLVLHWHGDDLRHFACRAYLKKHFLDNSDLNLVSTPDLQDKLEDAVLLENPVNTKMFDDFGWPRLNHAITLDNSTQERVLPHYMMPLLFNAYEEVTVLPGSKLGSLNPGLLSVSALEALSCNCRVTHHPKKNRGFILEHHSIPVVTKKLIELYGELK